MRLSDSFQDEKRCHLYGTVFGVWGVIAVYAMLHDQYIVTIAPEHFTLYHRDLAGIENARLLATSWGFLASIAPGLTLGIALYVVGRVGSRPQRTPRQLILSAVKLVVLTETMALISLTSTWITHIPWYPDRLYPDDSLSLLCTQTAQLTAYFTGILGACLLVVWTWRKRGNHSQTINLTPST